MPKTVKELSAVEVKRLSRPGMHAVGGVTGLLHRITDTGARGWVLRVRYAGKRRNYGLGGFLDVTLAQARERARKIKDDLLKGIDPIAERRAAAETLSVCPDARVAFCGDYVHTPARMGSCKCALLSGARIADVLRRLSS